MSQSFCNLLVHIVVSTKGRHPYLEDAVIRTEMHAYLGGVCRERDSHALLVGGTADHVHLLCALSKTVAVAALVADLKRSSSGWVKSNHTMGGHGPEVVWTSLRCPAAG